MHVLHVLLFILLIVPFVEEEGELVVFADEVIVGVLDDLLAFLAVELVF